MSVQAEVKGLEEKFLEKGRGKDIKPRKKKSGRTMYEKELEEFYAKGYEEYAAQKEEDKRFERRTKKSIPLEEPFEKAHVKGHYSTSRKGKRYWVGPYQAQREEAVDVGTLPGYGREEQEPVKKIVVKFEEPFKEHLPPKEASDDLTPTEGEKAGRPTLLFRNHTQKILYQAELAGQISDGKWKNVSGKHWVDMSTASDNSRVAGSDEKFGPKNFVPMRSYNFASDDLTEIVGDRMLFYAKASKFNPSWTEGDIKLLESIIVPDFNGDISAYKKTSGFPTNFFFYWEGKVKEVKERFGVANKEQAKELYDKIMAVPYNKKDLKRELKDMSKIAAGKGEKTVAGIDDPYKRIFGISGIKEKGRHMSKIAAGKVEKTVAGIERPKKVLYDPRKDSKHKEWEHERMRINNAMGWDAGEARNGRNILVSRMNRIADPQKMYNFALALEDENLHDLAGMAWDKLKDMGYDTSGRPVGSAETPAVLLRRYRSLYKKRLAPKKEKGRMIRMEKSLPKPERSFVVAKMEKKKTIKKAEETPKLTQREQEEWLRVTILRRAKDRINPNDTKCNILSVAESVYEQLVFDWMYNKAILEACRNLGVDQSMVLDIISVLFDTDGSPRPLTEKGFDTQPQQAGLAY